ncbi:MAG: hypothetical protein DRP09_14665 [Candidatus Thorarchaeota archaeon]|nr:MAG: hypothetical protein DRP09_14665 [Candidatus Thorarchaeota archaeon]
MDGSPKVLVAIPIFDQKDYIFKENFEAIKNIDYPNYDYVYIDNSKKRDYYELLKSRGANVVRVPRGYNSRQALCNSQNYARDRVIREGYDYLMFVESDLVPTPECIKRLMSHGGGIVGATYLIGTKVKVPCIFFKDWKPGNHQMGTRIIRLDEVDNFLNTGLRRIHGMGLGCTLIRSDIIKRFPYYYDERPGNNKKHSDVYFYMQLDNAHIPVYVDTNYMIEHFPSKWDLVEDR